MDTPVGRLTPGSRVGAFVGAVVGATVGAFVGADDGTVTSSTQTILVVGDMGGRIRAPLTGF